VTYLQASNISKSFDTPVVDSVDIDIDRGGALA